VNISDRLDKKQIINVFLEKSFEQTFI